MRSNFFKVSSVNDREKLCSNNDKNYNCKFDVYDLKFKSDTKVDYTENYTIYLENDTVIRLLYDDIDVIDGYEEDGEKISDTLYKYEKSYLVKLSDKYGVVVSGSTITADNIGNFEFR